MFSSQNFYKDTHDNLQDIKVTTNQSPREFTYSHAIVLAHGIDPKSRNIISVQNFITGMSQVGEAPLEPILYPENEAYLNLLGISTSFPGDIVITIPPQPGLLDYYRDIGVLAHNTKLIIVDPNITFPIQGFPNFDILSLLARDTEALRNLKELLKGKEEPYFISTFCDNRTQKLATKLGFLAIQAPSALYANDKYAFRKASEEYKYTMLPASFITNDEDVRLAVRRMYEEEWVGAWLKLPVGAGGDTVIFIKKEENEQRTTTKILEATHTIYKIFTKAFEVNDYGGDAALEQLWNKDSVAPFFAPLILEADVRSFGKIICNLSNSIVVKSNGDCEILGTYRQFTDDEGSYIGSYPYNVAEELGEHVEQAINEQVAYVAKYCTSIGHYGLGGIDYFVYEDRKQQKQIGIIELNGRISASGIAHTIADKVKAPYWINLITESPVVIKDMSDYKTVLGDLAHFYPGNFSKPKIIPQAIGTIWNKEEMVIPSKHMKILIVGEDYYNCTDAYNRLLNKQFKF